jgi:hypothetical protein
MAASSFLGGTTTSEPWRNIVTKTLTTGSVTSASASLASATVGALTVNTGLQVTGTIVTITGGISNFSASSGGTYVPTPADLLSGTLFYYNGAGVVNFQMPSVASINAYLVSQGFPAANNTTFDMPIFNASAFAITVTNGGDATWNLGLTPTFIPTIAATSTARCTVLVALAGGAVLA